MTALDVTFRNMVNDLVACALIEGANPTATATAATKAAKQLVLDAFETVNVQRERQSHPNERFECCGCSLFSSKHELVDGKCPRCHCRVQPAYLASNECFTSRVAAILNEYAGTDQSDWTKGDRQILDLARMADEEIARLKGAHETNGRQLFLDHASILGDPGKRRISMSFEKREHFEAALSFLDMDDFPEKAPARHQPSAFDQLAPPIDWPEPWKRCGHGQANPNNCPECTPEKTSCEGVPMDKRTHQPDPHNDMPVEQS